ncbi:hypothetical protein ACPEEZ_08735 [Frigoribacterium sp. 2-23]|uniref:hypothetical protein n=1 Tax=Frigoribacterium sp. 2-23 TaxID=3415006 RepID=UPI003C6FF163
MSKPLRHPPRFTADIVADARHRLEALVRDLAHDLDEAGDDIERVGETVSRHGWELASLGQWLGLEGEALLLLGGASYPEIADQQGTTASNVYNRVGRSLTLAPYAQAKGSVTRVTGEQLQEARREYALENPSEGGDVDLDPTASLSDRVPGLLADGPRTTSEIIDALEAAGGDYRRSSVLSTLSVLARQGRIARVGHGVYAVPHS